MHQKFEHLDSQLKLNRRVRDDQSQKINVNNVQDVGVTLADLDLLKQGLDEHVDWQSWELGENRLKIADKKLSQVYVGVVLDKTKCHLLVYQRENWVV